MAKRIFSLITVIAIMLSLFAISANATVYINQDFSDSDLNLNDGKWYKYQNVPEAVEWVMEIDDGAYHMRKEAGASGSKNDIQQSIYFPNVVPAADRTEMSGAYHHADETKRYYLMSDTSKEYIIEYDYMIPDMTMYQESEELLSGSYVYADIYFNGFRQSWQLMANRIKTGSGAVARQTYFDAIFPDAANYKDLEAFEGRWITIAHHFWYDHDAEHQPLDELAAKYTNWKSDIYVKAKGEAEWAVALIDNSMNIHNNNTNDYMRFYVYPQYCIDVKFDNLRVYSGTELMENAVVNEDNIVTSSEEVTAGEITASGTVSTTEPKEGLRKIMVAYDKSGKMIDFKSGTQNLYIGPNEVSSTIELDDAEAAAIADGGYVGLYLWDGMLPYINAVELK